MKANQRDGDLLYLSELLSSAANNNNNNNNNKTSIAP